MEYPNQQAKLSNGGTILNEVKLEPEVRLIHAYYPLSNDRYVIWQMNTWDRSTYWGHYFSRYGESFDFFTDKYVKKLSIDMEAFKSFNVKCCQYDTENETFSNCSIRSNWEVVCVYGITNNDVNQLLTIHYNTPSATMYAQWLSNRYKVQYFNTIDGRYDGVATTGYYNT